MDFVEVTLNPLIAEYETEANSVEMEGEKKMRRYWTPKEEERFHEIWGRENWRLTRYGKNTIFFAQWADEMSERWNMDVKPEEVQMKVNQTKAKYRQVMKVMDVEKSNLTKWKKFEIVDKILRNEHRPADAEPIPAEALEKHRDFSPVFTSTATTAHQNSVVKTTSAQIAETNPVHQENHHNLDMSSAEDVNATETDSLHTNTLFNSNDSHSTSQYSIELFTDHIKQEDVKTNDFQGEFTSYENLYSQSQSLGQPQLTQLQTPEQHNYQQQQTQQQQQYQTQTQNQTPTSHPHQQLQQHIQQLQQQQQIQRQQQEHQQIQQQQKIQHQHTQQQTQQYDQPLNSYNIPPPQSTNSRSLLVNNKNHYHNDSTATGAGSAAQSSAINQYTNNYVAPSTNASTEANSSDNSNSMQPPRIKAPVCSTVAQQTRKRRASVAHPGAAAAVAAATSIAAADSLECLYLEEVRKKNAILDEQKEISRQRLILEERKVALMEQFFPKCLKLQEQILQKLNSVQNSI